MASLDRLERLTDLVLVLLNATTPRTLEEIAHAVPGYPAGHEARRQAFERDKRLLREEGIPVLTEPVEGPEQFGYRIDPEAFYLPELGLEPEEQAALHLAVAGVHLGDPSGRDALAKLGATGVGDTHPIAAIDPPPALVPLFAAVRSQAEVTFSYRSERRTVAPAILRFRGGKWYLVGWDRGRGAARTFRVDRIEGTPEPGPPASARLPDGVEVAEATLEPWRVVEEDEDEHVLVAVDAVEAPRVLAEVGERAVIERRGDGSVVLRLGSASPELLRSWVLGLLDHAEVLGPADARSAMVAWLRSIASGVVGGERGNGAAAPAPGEQDRVGGDGVDGRATLAGGPAGGPHGVRTTSRPPPAPGSAGTPSRQRTLPASARLRRLLAIVAWLAEVGEAPIHDVAARFGIAESEVVRELELAACCGVPPYSPDTLLEIVVTDESVQAFLPRELARPRRLTPAEGLALAASARTILAVPGADRDGALARALGKLDAVLGDHRRLVIDLDAPPLLPEARSLVEDGSQAELEYHSASTDETTVRVVDPLAVLSLDGHWYLDAFCHRAGGVRRFRVDRIRRIAPTGAPVEHRPERDDPGAGRPEAFVPGPSTVPLRLRLQPGARWVLDTVPVLEEMTTASGETEVTLAVGGTAWLERLLLQLGPLATVLEPPDMVGTAPRAAERLLARYL